MSQDDFKSLYGVDKPRATDKLVFYGLREVKCVTATEIAQKLGFRAYVVTCMSLNQATHGTNVTNRRSPQKLRNQFNPMHYQLRSFLKEKLRFHV